MVTRCDCCGKEFVSDNPKECNDLCMECNISMEVGPNLLLTMLLVTLVVLFSPFIAEVLYVLF